MTDASLPAGRFTQGDFRLGHVFSLAWTVFSGNFLRFTIVAAIVLLPTLLLVRPTTLTLANPFPNPGWFVIAFLAMLVLYPLSQAILLHMAFQDMTGRPVKLAESTMVGLRRFFPIIGIGLIVVLVLALYMVGMALAVVALGQFLQSPGLVVLATVIGIIPLFMLYLMWFVAIPACVVERLGPLRSLGRSRALTKGHRWKILGMILLILIAGLIVGILVGILVGVLLTGLGAGSALGVSSVPSTAGQVVNLILNAILTAFLAILIAVTYHDLRVAKEGVGTEQIAAVFE
jgi:Membrane domain of glycerophosphoryl diester phosphodiesterase